MNQIKYDCFVDVELECIPISERNEISISAIKYSFSQSHTRSFSNDATDFELLIDALRILPQSILNRTSNSEENSNMLQNCPRSYTLHLKPYNFIHVDLLHLTPDEQVKALIDLICHLKQFHEAGFIVSFFDIYNFVAYDKELQQYILIGFPYLIIDNDVLFRGKNVVPDYRYAARSQLFFKGSSKPSDYLALLKNYLVYTHIEEYHEIQSIYFSNKDNKLTFQENLFLNNITCEIHLSYTIDDDCNCDLEKLYCNECLHQSTKIVQKLPVQIIKSLRDICQNLSEYEYEKVYENKLNVLTKINYETMRELMIQVKGIIKDITKNSGDQSSILLPRQNEIKKIYKEIKKRLLLHPPKIDSIYKQNIKFAFEDLQACIKQYFQVVSKKQ